MFHVLQKKLDNIISCATLKLMEGTLPTSYQETTMSTDGKFHTSANELEDRSVTHDVYFSDSEGQYLIAEPASQHTAEEMADALQKLRRRFLECGSDRAVLAFAAQFESFMERHSI